MNSSKLAQISSGILFLALSIKSLILQASNTDVAILLILGAIYAINEFFMAKADVKKLREEIQSTVKKVEDQNIEIKQKMESLSGQVTAVRMKEGMKQVRF